VSPPCAGGHPQRARPGRPAVARTYGRVDLSRSSLNHQGAGNEVQVTVAAVAMELSHISTANLHAFDKQCENARRFSQYFWWAL
jgi:hypothetical protein